MKKVPAIVDTDNENFALAESHAIMRYSFVSIKDISVVNILVNKCGTQKMTI